MQHELDHAYRQTLYQVNAGTQILCLEIGKYDAITEQRLMAACGLAREWAILTPFNPASIALCQQENEARIENFHQLLESESYRWIPSCHRDPDGQWPDEIGALVFDITTSVAREIARAFGQHAWVHTERGHAPELCWVKGD